MKHIIITGASGLVATELALHLLDKTDSFLYLLSTHPEKVQARYSQKEYAGRVLCLTLDAFSSFALTHPATFEACIHTAFARTSQGRSLVQSLEYLRQLLSLLQQLDVRTFANISSQSVYGSQQAPLWKETTPPDPSYLYAMGKYASEVITELALGNKGIKWTNIRLCSVCENARFIRIFVQNALNGEPIRLTAPNQQCSFIDVRDVADALLSFIARMNGIKPLPAYNLGTSHVHTIAEIATIVKRIGEENYGLPNISIIKEKESCMQPFCGMDASLFMKTFDWKPNFNMDRMVESLYEMLLNTRGGGVYPRSFRLVYGL